MPKTIVVGLDCAAPALVFDRFRADMPNVSRLMADGLWGRLRSVMPPITVPAWTCMVSGRDPGELGLYGFRNRVPRTYDLRVATSTDVREKRLWDWLGDAGYRVAPLFVPLTWPPQPVRGEMASCFLTPGAEAPWTFPPDLGRELENLFGPYHSDVADHRQGPSQALLDELFAMAEQHFAIATHVLRTRTPDFLMMVEMGTDRLHHGFWRHLDPQHPEHDPRDPFVDGCRRYYAFLDAKLGDLFAEAEAQGGGDVLKMVVSDHGARRIEGGVRINNWLVEEGHLVLRDGSSSGDSLDLDAVDFSRTSAYGEGGYYGRIFFNVRGRDPEGIVAPRHVDALRASIHRGLANMRWEDGSPMNNRIIIPSSSYRETRGSPPDLTVCFGDLAYRSLGGLGPEGSPRRVLVEPAAMGGDGCNHDWDGIFVMAGGGTSSVGERQDLSLYDVTPTVLAHMGVPAADGLLGSNRLRNEGFRPAEGAGEHRAVSKRGSRP